MAQNILSFNSGATGLPSDLYVYPGQICQVPGIADPSGNEYNDERLPRDLADIITTQSDDYRVFAVSQVLKQAPDGSINPDTTQRIEATLSRTPDTGPGSYGMGDWDDAPDPVTAFLRSEYRPSAAGAFNKNAPRYDPYTLSSGGSCPIGGDQTPNTSDDWLITQKIEVTRYQIAQ